MITQSTQKSTDAVDRQRAEFQEETVRVWQPRSARRLTSEDARQAIENVTGYFDLLRKWAAAETSGTVEMEAA